MKLWAVSCITWDENNLVTEFHRGDTWKEALKQHSTFNKEHSEDQQKWLDEMPDDQEKAKQYAFDCDGMIEVKEVPQG